MASYWFNEGAEEIAKKQIDWVNDTIRARLVGSLPARTITSMTGVTALTGAEDQTLGTKSIVKDDTNHQVKYVAANPTFPTVDTSQTAAACVVFKFGTGDADSVPLCVHDVTDTPTNGGDITIDWPVVNSTDGTVMYQTNS